METKIAKFLNTYVAKSKPSGIEDLFALIKGEKPYTGRGERSGPQGDYSYCCYDDDKEPTGSSVDDVREPDAPIEAELKKELLAMGFVEKLDHLPEHTSDAHKGADGAYVEERRRLHSGIIAAALNEAQPVPDSMKPTAVLMMGGPGSGKSSATRGMDFSNFVSVDPDAIKAQLPEYREATNTEPDPDKPGEYRQIEGGGPRALNAAFMAHNESSEVADQIGPLAVSQRKNVLFDGTGKNLETMMERVKKLKEEGYHIKLLMPHLPVNEGKKRAAARAKTSGRWVPFSVLDEAYSKIPGNFMEVSKHVDESMLFDNNVAMGDPAKLMYTTTGGVGTTHDDGLFDSFQQHVNKALRIDMSKNNSIWNQLPMQQAQPQPQQQAQGEGGEPPDSGEKPPSVSNEEIIELFQQGLRDNEKDVQENGHKKVGAGPQPLLD